MRKRIVITGGLLALFFLVSSSSVFAQNLQISPDEAATIKTEINSGKPVKDVLKDHAITMDKIRLMLNSGDLGNKKVKLSNTQIASIASQLHLDPIEIQAEIDAGKTLQEILKAHAITLDQVWKVSQDVSKKDTGQKNKKHR